MPFWGALIGAATGVAISAALVAGGTLKVPPARDGRDASADFLAAWERSRRGTYVVESDFRRTLSDGRTLFSLSSTVQRPPDRILRQFGGVSGVVDGHDVMCSTDATGGYKCFAGKAAATPYEQDVQADLDNFRSYFTTSPRPLYRVGYIDEGCFEFFVQIFYPDPDYGNYAKFCFDEATGAMRYLERHLANDVIETVEATSIRANVTPDDLRTDRDTSYESRIDLGAGPIVQPTGSVPTGPSTSLTPSTAPSDPRPPTPSIPADIAGLSNRELIARGDQIRSIGGDSTTLVAEAIARLKAGQMSINDSVWIADSGRPSPFALTVTTEMLRLGYVPT